MKLFQFYKIPKIYVVVIFLMIFDASYGQISHFFRDESDKDESFLHFKADVLQAIKQGDSTKFVSFFNDTIATGRYGCYKYQFIEKNNKLVCSKENFLKNISITGLQNQIKEVFQYGFSLEVGSGTDALIKDGMAYFESFPAKKEYRCVLRENGFCSLIIGTNINLREGPGLHYKIVKQVSNVLCYEKDLVSTIHDPASDLYWSTVWLDGKILYVADKYVLTSVELVYVEISKRKNGWKIITYVEPEGC